ARVRRYTWSCSSLLPPTPTQLAAPPHRSRQRPMRGFVSSCWISFPDGRGGPPLVAPTPGLALLDPDRTSIVEDDSSAAHRAAVEARPGANRRSRLGKATRCCELAGAADSALTAA